MRSFSSLMKTELSSGEKPPDYHPSLEQGQGTSLLSSKKLVPTTALILPIFGGEKRCKYLDFRDLGKPPEGERYKCKVLHFMGLPLGPSCN